MTDRLSYRHEFVPCSSFLWLCIRLHGAGSKSHIGTSYSGSSFPLFLYLIEILIPVRKRIPVSCKRRTTVRFTIVSNIKELFPK